MRHHRGPIPLWRPLPNRLETLEESLQNSFILHETILRGDPVFVTVVYNLRHTFGTRLTQAGSSPNDGQGRVR